MASCHIVSYHMLYIFVLYGGMVAVWYLWYGCMVYGMVFGMVRYGIWYGEVGIWL